MHGIAIPPDSCHIRESKAAGENGEGIDKCGGYSGLTVCLCKSVESDGVHINPQCDKK